MTSNENDRCSKFQPAASSEPVCGAAILGGKCGLKAGHRPSPTIDDENMHKLAASTEED